jgi:hypothetical protein
LGKIEQLEMTKQRFIVSEKKSVYRWPWSELAVAARSQKIPLTIFLFCQAAGEDCSRKKNFFPAKMIFLWNPISLPI